LPVERIALHAQSMTLKHPTSKEEIVIDCPLPEDWPASY
jgi:23S rRNA-/tRNA-specific pseudouridylate synthase